MKRFKQILLVIMFLVTPTGFAEQPSKQPPSQPKLHYNFDICVLDPKTMDQSGIAHLENITSPTFYKVGIIHTDKENNGYFEYCDEHISNYDGNPNYKSMIAAGFIREWECHGQYRFKAPQGKVYQIKHLIKRQ